jgi:hypothetical protein
MTRAGHLMAAGLIGAENVELLTRQECRDGKNGILNSEKLTNSTIQGERKTVDKIKLPLRVEMIGLFPDSIHFPAICDSDGDIICSHFDDQQIAQLFADCFTAFTTARNPKIPYEHYFDIELRAAEAVEE